jgi:protein-L-isoaspartate(D-aspartate) O-methyltransferase
LFSNFIEKMMQAEDDFLIQGRRKALVDLLRTKHITDEKVLAAIGRVKRHIFFNKDFQQHAYDDKPFSIDAGQTISQPYTVAFQTQLLEIKNLDKVLEIGTGSGYQAIILAECGARVFSIERQKVLFDKTKPLIAELGYDKIKCFYGDGFKGVPSYAPYDKIIITAAAPEIPEDLKNQLKVGGYLVIPLGTETSTMIRLKKVSDTEFTEEHFHEFHFVPMLKGTNH